MAEDRRIKKTKNRIRKAMVNCLQTTSFEKITIKELCERADINRSTFYAHYSDTMVVYCDIETTFLNGLDELFEEYENNNSSYEWFIRSLLEYFFERKEVFLVLIQVDGKSFCHEFEKRAREYDWFHSQFEKQDEVYVIDFYVNAVLSVIYRWLTSGRERGVDDMTALLLEIFHLL